MLLNLGRILFSNLKGNGKVLLAFMFIDWDWVRLQNDLQVAQQKLHM